MYGPSVLEGVQRSIYQVYTTYIITLNLIYILYHLLYLYQLQDSKLYNRVISQMYVMYDQLFLTQELGKPLYYEKLAMTLKILCFSRSRSSQSLGNAWISHSRVVEATCVANFLELNLSIPGV